MDKAVPHGGKEEHHTATHQKDMGISAEASGVLMKPMGTAYNELEPSTMTQEFPVSQ